MWLKLYFKTIWRYFVICSVSILTNHVLFALCNNTLWNQHGFYEAEILLTTQKMDLNIIQK